MTPRKVLVTAAPKTSIWEIPGSDLCRMISIPCLQHCYYTPRYFLCFLYTLAAKYEVGGEELLRIFLYTKQANHDSFSSRYTVYRLAVPDVHYMSHPFVRNFYCE